MRNRILVIDDSQLALDAIADVLDKGGFDVRVSTDVSHLSTAFGDWHPDLILTDVHMPDISGADLCRKLKSSYDTAHVPVVLFSSMEHDELEELARTCEADGFLSKNANLDALPKELAYLIETTVF